MYFFLCSSIAKITGDRDMMTKLSLERSWAELYQEE